MRHQFPSRHHHLLLVLTFTISRDLTCSYVMLALSKRFRASCVNCQTISEATCIVFIYTKSTIQTEPHADLQKNTSNQKKETKKNHQQQRRILYSSKVKVRTFLFYLPMFSLTIKFTIVLLHFNSQANHLYF